MNDKNIDFSAIAKETYEELTKNLNDDSKFQDLTKVIIQLSIKTSEVMLRKYHEQLQQEKK